MTRKINYTSIPTEGLVYQADLDGGVPSGSSASNITWIEGDRGYVEECAEFSSTSTLDTNYSLDETGNFSISIQGVITTRTWGHFFSTFNNNTNYEWWVGSWNLTDSNEGKLFFSGQGYNTYYSTTRIDDGEYHSIQITRDSSNNSLKLYIDEVLEIDVTEAFSQEADTLKLGTNSFTGKLGLCRVYDQVLTQDEVSCLHQEGLRKYGPTNAPISGNFPKYSLPNLEEGKVLEYSRSQVGGSYIDQTGSGANGVATNAVDSTSGLYNVMSLTSGSISWDNISFSTAICFEYISGKWEIQINPSYITSTGITSTTKQLYGIMLWDRVLSNLEERKLFYNSKLI